jgi:hypothetical protein
MIALRHFARSFLSLLALLCALTAWALSCPSFYFAAHALDNEEGGWLEEPPAASAEGKAPVLSILYDACTYGELRPCPT